MVLINDATPINASYAQGIKIVQTLINATQVNADYAIYKGKPVNIDTLVGVTQLSDTDTIGKNATNAIVGKTFWFDSSVGDLPAKFNIAAMGDNVAFADSYYLTSTQLTGRIYTLAFGGDLTMGPYNLNMFGPYGYNGVVMITANK